MGITVGSVVKLRSIQGPSMLVVAVETEGARTVATAQWFDTTNRLRTGLIPVEALQLDVGEPTLHGVIGWIRLRDLRPGAIFETETGVMAVKSEYVRAGGMVEATLLATGEYANFGAGSAEHNGILVRELKLLESGGTP